MSQSNISKGDSDCECRVLVSNLLGIYTVVNSTFKPKLLTVVQDWFCNRVLFVSTINWMKFKQEELYSKQLQGSLLNAMMVSENIFRYANITSSRYHIIKDDCFLFNVIFTNHSITWFILDHYFKDYGKFSRIKVSMSSFIF